MVKKTNFVWGSNEIRSFDHKQSLYDFEMLAPDTHFPDLSLVERKWMLICIKCSVGASDQFRCEAHLILHHNTSPHEMTSNMIVSLSPVPHQIGVEYWSVPAILILMKRLISQKNAASREEKYKCFVVQHDGIKDIMILCFIAHIILFCIICRFYYCSRHHFPHLKVVILQLKWCPAANKGSFR